MELRTYIGKKPKKLEFRKTESGDVELETKLAPNLKLDTPIMIGHMSFGAISLNSQLSMAKAVAETGTYMGTGEGGLHKELYPYQDHMIVQVASGRRITSYNVCYTKLLRIVRYPRASKKFVILRSSPYVPFTPKKY